MSRNSSIVFQFLTYSMLMGLAYGLIGERVKSTKPGQFRYVVSVSGIAVYDSNFGNLHLCTGNLIKPRSVLTVAHCLKHKTPSEIEIIAGSENLINGKRYFPESWITYDQWTNAKNHHSLHDIAVIKLRGEGIVDIQPADLLFAHGKINNERLRIMGWGNLQNGQQPFQLRSAILQVISNQECSAKGTNLKGKHFSVPSNYFCSKAEPWVLSSCGDGGAPLINTRNLIVGINIGTCPLLEGFPPSFLHQNLLNSHLHISHYQNFITEVWK